MAAPRIRRPALAIGGLVFVGAGAAIGFGVFDEASVTHRQSVTGVERIELDKGAGDVAIRAGDVEAARVVETKSYRWGDDDPVFEVRDDVLTLPDCGMWCTTTHEIVVPRGVAVSGDIGSGELDVTGAESLDVEVGSGGARVSDVEGDARVDAGSGHVELSGIGGEVTVDAGSGGITGRGLAGPVEAESGSGEITLELSRPAGVTASTGSGDIALTVPRADYRIAGDSGSGSREIGVDTSPGARHTLSLDTGSGDVTVRRR
ncbi:MULTISPECIES: DUF4097 family beta strand repeat-containing protein [Prauserella salsuginis group]|uniref:DUF4097 domain-containing protein n=2 Tax=Prauserella salsuginis group TaxID=2893672 RepID=A0A839XK28_9PSEU|nr:MULTISPECIES: DUF4097 family beta strand repeat-containing protein [Prauserella salsuginis group]MBB3662907.1 hypothetical protein [Prauserella sediminis]MCR3721357.1 putative adhesin [Prauserella flava]MCR3734563.1 putative adhesin [Prauserella salsuginis]